MVRVVRIDELPAVRAAGITWRPIRRTLGITGFGTNAYSARAGELLIEDHDETGRGASSHEELYIVVTGHATFTVDGEVIDAPAGTLVFVPEPTSRRSARAAMNETTAVVVGGAPGTITPSPWEYSFAAQPAADAGDPAGAYEVAEAGLADHPENPALHYRLACYASLAGETNRALEHLIFACDRDPDARARAATDRDLDPIRSESRFPG